MKNTKQKILALALLAVLVAGVVCALVFLFPRGEEGAKTVVVEVVFADLTTKEHTLKTDAAYLRQAMEEKDLIAGSESEYGLMVETVDGVTADSSKEEWWCITKDGEMTSTGVDDTPIADGDHYEFTLTTGF